MESRAFASATQLAREIRDRSVGCLELLDFYLGRAERFNPALNAVIAWQVDAARERAREADAALARGDIWGPLHGVPMTVKESFNITGLPTTWGNPAWRDNIAQGNAVVVDRLLGAGAVIYGKTNVPLMLMDMQSYNDIYGTTNNPWDVSRIPGGSSGGSAAALAAGLSALEAGSDIASSLRNPAHFCGVYGHKPSWGIIPTRGQSPMGALSPTDISVAGPMARHAEDLALAMGILAGPDLLQGPAWKLELPQPRHKRLRDYRVGVWTHSALCEIDDSVRERFAAAVSALRKAGAAVDETARPPIDDEEHQRLFMLLLRAAGAGRVSDAEYARQRELAATVAPDDMGFVASMARGVTIDHRGWGIANEARTQLRYRWREVFEKIDVLLAPVTTTPAFPHDHTADRDARTLIVNGKPRPYGEFRVWAGPASVSYLPATAAPLGLTPAGLPVGMQVIGAEGDDLTTIEFARVIAEEIGGFIAPPGYE